MKILCLIENTAIGVFHGSLAAEHTNFVSNCLSKDMCSEQLWKTDSVSTRAMSRLVYCPV
jgi:hypothetical protein